MKVLPSGRVMIVGTGMVGSSTAYALLNQQIAREIMLFDIEKELNRSQKLDLQDASAFTVTTKIRLADYSDLEDGDIMVVTSGSPQKDGMTRLDLLNANAEIIKEIAKIIRESGKTVFVIMITNPVDILTYIMQLESGLPERMVMGTGTYLDTGRLRVILAEMLKVNSKDISAYIFGEHGDSSFPVLGDAEVAGVNLSNFIEINDAVYEQLTTQVRERAYEIIKGKKSTHFGIGATVASMCRMIIRDENHIIPMTALLTGQYSYSDVCTGVLARLGSTGYEVAPEIELTEKEKQLFNNSVEILKSKYLEYSK